MAIALVLQVALCVDAKSPRKQRNASTPVACHGYDISHHNDEVQWDKIKDAQFVYAKATEGLRYNDPCYKKHLKKGREFGIPMGAYHFMSSQVSGKQQFEHFKAVVGRNTDLIPVLDVELDDLTVENLQEFIDACKNYYGTRPIIYVSPKRYERYRKAFDGCMWWMAHHTATTDRKDYVIWQYKIDKVHGMKLDHNCLHPNYSVRSLLLGKGAAKKAGAVSKKTRNSKTKAAPKSPKRSTKKSSPKAKQAKKNTPKKAVSPVKTKPRQGKR